ncbi:hypothetical protein BDR26DRAFT_1006914 [Obelidium mucronatum]|nr:hypothetical protein BDR26DRAFT_1006914 [Obelidium mucronatum]
MSKLTWLLVLFALVSTTMAAASVQPPTPSSAEISFLKNDKATGREEASKRDGERPNTIIANSNNKIPAVNKEKDSPPEKYSSRLPGASSEDRPHTVKHEKPHGDTAEARTEKSFFALLFSLVFVVSMGIGGGRFAEKFKQPPMLGMLGTGLLLRNLLRGVVLPLPHSWTTPLWTIALSAVTARAGLSLQTSVISANLYPTLMLGAIPVLLESFFLAGLVGIGVVVPLLLNLQDKPHWKNSRVPPLLLAATGLDVLIATTGFGIALAAIFGHSHEYDSPHDPAAQAIEHTSWYTRAVEEIFLGIGGGMVFGFLGVYLLRRKNPEQFCTMVIFILSTYGMMFLKSFGFPGAASSTIIVCWAIIGNLWDKDQVDASNKRLKLIWNLAEPFLFPLIGASVCFMEIRPVILILSLLCVFISICVRMTVSFFTSQMAGLSIDEQIFTCGLWSGKASVQAALSTTTIELVHQYKLQNTEADDFSRIVFACMVSAIMLGAPFAATWVSIFGHRSEDGYDGPSDKNIDKD